jgi:uncharacterized protein (TIRG00374 family)
MKRVPPALLLLLKILISAGLLVFFVSRIDLGGFLETLASADVYYVTLVLVIYLLAQVIAVLRWIVLARPLGFENRFREMVVYYFIGMFFNLFAPSTVGGDVTRVYYLARNSREEQETSWRARTLQATIAVLADRAIGMTVLVWLGAVALAVFSSFAVPSAVRLATFAVALGLVAGGVLLPILQRRLPATRPSVLTKVRLALDSYQHRWTAVAQAVALSLIVHLVQAGMHVLIGRALHFDIPLSYCFILYPLVGTFAALPITFNGIGLREGGYLLLLGVIGIDSERAIAFGLLLFLIVAIDSLVGGIVFIFNKGPKPSLWTAPTET